MPMPFDYTDLAYMLDYTSSLLYKLNLVTGTRTQHLFLTPSFLASSMVYNDLDQLLYLYDVHTHQLCNLDDEGTLTPCPTQNLPEKNYNALTLTIDGTLYLYESLDVFFYTLSLDEKKSDFLVAKAHPIVPSQIESWCFHPHLPYLYTFSQNGQILQINPTTGLSTPFVTQGMQVVTHYHMFFDYDGILYLVDTIKSNIYRITLHDNQAQGEHLCALDFSLRQAAFCRSILAPLPLSLGSAPPPYLTHLVDNGPRHVSTALLTLNVPDVLPDFSLVESMYALELEVMNQTGKEATLYGWIDWDQEGTFKKTHLIEPLNIPSLLNTSQQVTLCFKRPPMEQVVLGTTYMRLRLTTDTLTLQNTPSLHDSRALGPASDGEIQDLPLLIQAPPPTHEGILYEKVAVDQVLESSIHALDPCGGPLLYQLETPPTKGKLHLNTATGHFTYTPHTDTCTSDQFTILVTSSMTQLSVVVPVQVAIEKAALQVAFVPSATQVTAHDSLTYTATLYNTGSLPLEQLLIHFSLPEGIVYEKNSLKVNGIQDLMTLPTFGITLIKLMPHEQCSICFNVCFSSAPSVPFTLSCRTQCSYALSPLHPTCTLEMETASSCCTLKSPDLDVQLSASTDSAFLEDLIQYTISLNNTGDVPLQNVFLSLALPLEMLYKGELTYNHMPVHSSLLEGYTIKTLAPGEKYQLQFKASPNTPASTSTLTTVLFTNYDYVLDDKQCTCEPLTHTHTLTLHQPSFTLTKSSNKKSVNLGETFTYTLCVTNESQVPIQEVILKESIPDFLQVVSICQNEQPMRHTLEQGICLGDLPPLSHKDLTIELKVLQTACFHKVLTYPTLGIFKLLMGTGEKVFYLEALCDEDVFLTYPSLLLSQHTDTKEYVVGETITYEIQVENNGTLELHQVQVEDLLTPALRFVTGSVYLEDTPLPNASIISGISVGTLLPQTSKTIRFDALILSHETKPIETSPSSTYTYMPYGTSYEKVGFKKSEPYFITPINPCVEITGSVSPSIAYLHDQLDYTFYITNTGDVDAINVMVNHTFSSTQLIDGSFKINQVVTHNVPIGTFIPIGNLLKGDTTVITLSVQVTGSPRHEDAVIHQVDCKFMYHTKDFLAKYATCPSFKLSTPLTLSTFKQVSLEHTLELPYDKLDLALIHTIKGDVQLLKTYIVQTPKGVLASGQSLTGSKLMIHALLDVTMEYAADDVDSCVCTVHYSLPFSTFIVLSETTSPHTKMHVDTQIQHISWKILNNRCFFICASALMIGRTL